MNAPTRVSAGRPTECLRCGLAFQADEPVVALQSGAGWAHATCPDAPVSGDGPAVACQHCGRAGAQRGPLVRLADGEGEPVWVCLRCADPAATWTADEVLAKVQRRRSVGLDPDLTMAQAVAAVGGILASRHAAGEPLRQRGVADDALEEVSAALRERRELQLTAAMSAGLVTELKRRLRS